MTPHRSFPYILILIVIAVGGYFLFSGRTSRPVGADVPSDANLPDTYSPAPISRGELIDVDGSTYRFDSVHFILSDAGVTRVGIPLTTVRFQFDSFVRNGIPIAVLPYRLGTHQGVCAEVSGIVTSLTPDQHVLGYARCWWSGVGKEFVVFQDGSLVVAQYRSIAEGETSLEPLKPLLTIDITSVVEE